MLWICNSITIEPKVFSKEKQGIRRSRSDINEVLHDAIPQLCWCTAYNAKATIQKLSLFAEAPNASVISLNEWEIFRPVMLTSKYLSAVMTTSQVHQRRPRGPLPLLLLRSPNCELLLSRLRCTMFRLLIWKKVEKIWNYGDAILTIQVL